MTWVYFLKAKLEAFEVFLEFKVMVEKENGCHIKCLRIDGGGEYMSHSFDDYLREQGIRRQITCRYTPQQNGVAERKNRVITEIARAMMNEMNMPLTYWPEAVRTAVHIMNQTPTAAIHEISPYERLYGIKPTVSYMKVFGCVCYVHVPKEARKKMESKAVKCIFLGYLVEKKGYKCYDPMTRQVYVSRDVKFCEHEPWYKPKSLTIKDEYEEQENVRRVVDELGPSTRTISGPHMAEKSIGRVNPWSGRLQDKKQDEKGKKNMFEESLGDESFDEEHGLPHLRTPSSKHAEKYVPPCARVEREECITIEKIKEGMIGRGLMILEKIGRTLANGFGGIWENLGGSTGVGVWEQWQSGKRQYIMTAGGPPRQCRRATHARQQHAR
ncbi:hypothetical protein L7F22_033625 [Adiantum nelumboides]|nr:hypothetical protein [Adiantum nelumboides]